MLYRAGQTKNQSLKSGGMTPNDFERDQKVYE